jgi:hypothetical protein
MNGEFLIVFIILLFGFILFSVLGSRFFVEGMENSSQTFYGPNGGTATSSNEELVITMPDGSTNTFKLTDASLKTYSGPNGANAKVVTNSDGTNSLIVTSSDGTVTTYNSNMTDLNTSDATNSSSNSNVTTTSYDNYNHYSGTSYPTIFYGPNGATARVIETPNDNTIVITNKNGTTDIYYIDRSAPDVNVAKYYGPNGGSAKVITDTNGQKAVEITGPNGSKVVYTATNTYSYNSQDDTINQYSADTNTTGSDYNTAYNYSQPVSSSTTISGPAGNTYSTYDSSAYYNSLPQGIPRSQIPPGQEDLYILKSEVIVPVCPPPLVIETTNGDNFDSSKCPPCPPCARCPEPAFSCKKVPNYDAFNQNNFPIPVLSNFSTFGL